MALQRAMELMAVFVSLQAAFVYLELVPVAMARPQPQPNRLSCSIIPTEECAFAVDSAGKRCVLETLSANMDWHVCQTSDITVSEGIPQEYIETDQCVKACGVSKMTVGLSTDALLSGDFKDKMCSADCRDNCFNLIDLYSNLASGEGKSLKEMCTHAGRQRNRGRVNLEMHMDMTAADESDVDNLAAAEGPSPNPTSGA